MFCPLTLRDPVVRMRSIMTSKTPFGCAGLMTGGLSICGGSDGSVARGGNVTCGDVPFVLTAGLGGATAGGIPETIFGTTGGTLSTALTSGPLPTGTGPTGAAARPGPRSRLSIRYIGSRRKSPGSGKFHISVDPPPFNLTGGSILRGMQSHPLVGGGMVARILLIVNLAR